MDEIYQPSNGCGELAVCHLGTIPYRDALAIQQDLRARRQSGAIPDTLLLLEHPPVYTRGRRSGAQELPFPERFYSDRGIDIVDTDRGGRLTYHGPGQLVGYPIMALTDIGRHLRTMEAAIVAALAEEGLEARSRCQEGPDYTGVWVPVAEGGQDRKIASIGVHVSRGVSTHGFAVNVDNDLSPFTWVVPCGLPDVQMTSLSHELPADRAVDPDAFRERIARCFCDAHGRQMEIVTPADLGLDTSALSLTPTPVTA
ncbi:MAG TPA: lipoyl(octanoyl) transferase LipB [Solirubrobacteraceae bacterium]|nr:lipoyl(octanoyl) transferase LipB [Solirubrobacteraceae bacterium]